MKRHREGDEVEEGDRVEMEDRGREGKRGRDYSTKEEIYEML